MFDKFGEFDSVEELNATAEGLLAEGDHENIVALAQENGLDPEDAQDYIDGMMNELATPITAALGRLAVDEKAAVSDEKEKRVVSIIFGMARSLTVDEQFCRDVMKKGRRAMDVFNGLKSYAKDNRNGNVGVACGTDKELADIMKAYYSKGKDDMKKVIKSLG